MSIREAARTAPSVDGPPRAIDNSPSEADEPLLRESSQNYYLRPATSLVARLCRAALTGRRVILYDAPYDPASGADAGTDRVLHEIGLDQIERIEAGPDGDEPSIAFEIRTPRRQAETLILWFRDHGWALGESERTEERDGWIEAITAARKRSSRPLVHATRRAGAVRPAAIDSDIGPIRRALAGELDVVRRLGDGGMSVVYEGRDPRLDRPVAIKRLKTDVRMTALEKSQFVTEARLSASLHHPFIVDVYAILEKGAEIFLIFEFIDGQTLEQRIRAHGRLDASALRKPLEHVCAALRFAHAQHVVHRDLKPSNIMLTTQGYAKVMDFGVARSITDTAGTPSAGDGDTSGTVPYMAPEQERGRSDVRSDLFSLGVTAYEALTGVLPFPGPRFYQQKERGEYAPIAAAAPEAPARLVEAIARCLTFDPVERWSSVEEFARAAGLE